ncbi:MAG: DNA-3-methyladenine glycosylase 2 family protein, partial [Actinomycetales bacterium]|nr:DNA-3-methyladenine glycosylase 2 family protein [Actinomycetales bacterium]
MSHSAQKMRKAADHILTVDSSFASIIELSPLCNIGRKKYQDVGHFQALVNSVIAQQLSVKAADTITARVTLALNNDVSPTSMRDVAELDLRSAGLSGAKTRTIKEMADAWHTNKYDFSDPKLSDHEIVTELTKLWGIGRWTAEMFLMFTLHRLDIWPTGDLAMRRGWEQIHGL